MSSNYVKNYHNSDDNWIKKNQHILYESLLFCSDINKKNCHKDINEFEIVEEIGHGAFGRVYQVKHIKSKEIYAMKVIPTDEIVKSNLEHQLKREIGIQMSTNHPNILKLYSVLIYPNLCILITEYCKNGTLFQLIKKNGALEERIAVKIFFEVVKSVDYLHTFDIIHRDIKLENILLTENFHVKLGDFGWSVWNDHKKKIVRQSTICGTLEYLPPEMLKKSRHYNKKVDNWALGILFFEMVVGSAPFNINNLKSKFSKLVKECEIPLPDYISENAKIVIKGLLKKEPEKRWSLEDIFNSELFKIYGKH
ncbi:Protein kinase domain and Serine/threonine-/dual specificity protein kinase, catalytic domain and Protein kinase-like domain-containing protein [Strongyloides ratti]|uniref:Aurora kinase n=1 Tax=Strongyloides ratti TaxID=34506 RepID=A0A090LFA1_STRRB|nr:Protein kinase domain and Serine/threonine-/dual specificity protein kinase, catalytic domain and Protein kinase-like domain-containing protein [Strongyloides ratti]CEF68471.1 Protein kinase domain and Serine/threonine-/dual specificity protein kinase, catalytic domain and Protein kinase-like domain-containing protein [Strongyloides ratti]